MEEEREIVTDELVNRILAEIRERNGLSNRWQEIFRAPAARRPGEKQTCAVCGGEGEYAYDGMMIRCFVCAGQGEFWLM